MDTGDVDRKRMENLISAIQEDKPQDVIKAIKDLNDVDIRFLDTVSYVHILVLHITLFLSKHFLNTF